MKIYENGTVRDMTAAEIAAMQQAQLEMEHNIAPLTDSDKIALMLAAIPEEPVPTMEPKVGYKWRAIYSSSAGFAWELVENPDALGTLANPLLYVALADGVPKVMNDETYFAEV